MRQSTDASLVARAQTAGMTHNRHYSGHHRKKPRVMRTGKTKRDHTSGAWANHRRNKDWRRATESR